MSLGIGVLELGWDWLKADRLLMGLQEFPTLLQGGHPPLDLMGSCAT